MIIEGKLSTFYKTGNEFWSLPVFNKFKGMVPVAVGNIIIEEIISDHPNPTVIINKFSFAKFMEDWSFESFKEGDHENLLTKIIVIIFHQTRMKTSKKTIGQKKLTMKLSLQFHYLKIWGLKKMMNPIMKIWYFIDNSSKECFWIINSYSWYCDVE